MVRLARIDEQLAQVDGDEILDVVSVATEDGEALEGDGAYDEHLATGETHIQPQARVVKRGDLTH